MHLYSTIAYYSTSVDNIVYYAIMIYCISKVVNA